MFKIRRPQTRAWPVTVLLLSCCAASGAIVETAQTFIAQFKSFSEKEFAAAVEAANVAHPLAAGETSPSMALMLQRNAHLFAALIVGWDGVNAEHGAPMAFSVAALTELVTGPDGVTLSRGINDALNQLRFGNAPEKNSSTSPAPGGNSAPVEATTNSPPTSPSLA